MTKERKKTEKVLTAVVMAFAISSFVHVLRGGAVIILDHHITGVMFRAFYFFFAALDSTIAFGIWRRKKLAILTLVLEQIILVFFCLANIVFTKQETLIAYHWPPKAYFFINWCGVLLSAAFASFLLRRYNSMFTDTGQTANKPLEPIR